MTGFINQGADASKGCLNQTDPACSFSATPDVAGYHTESDIPNYWTYAKDFVLQDSLFEPNASWSLPAHLFLVSEWSAKCTQYDNPSSRTNNLQSPNPPPPSFPINNPQTQQPIYAWTDMTYMLHKYGVSLPAIFDSPKR